MAQETHTTKEAVFVYFGPILLAVVGWFMAHTLTEVKNDVKTLLETNATLKEKVHQLEIKIEAMEKKCLIPRESVSDVLVDKQKTLVMTKFGFKYV